MSSKSFKYGAIFCGGQSRRMGRPKAGILLPNGITMIEHVYHALSEFCEDVVLVGHNKGIPESLAHLQRIEDRFPGCGPVGGLEALLASGLADEYLVVPCDLFQIHRRVLKPLADYKGPLPVVLEHGKNLEPLVGRYPAPLLELIQKRITMKKYSIHGLVAASRAATLEIPAEEIHALSNANRPEDLVYGELRSIHKPQFSCIIPSKK